MTRPRISPEARQLLETDLDSLEKLEAMRYLLQAQGTVSHVELMNALQLTREAAAALIGELARADLVFAGDPRGVRLGARAGSPACQELLQTYAEDRLTIASVLSTLAMDRIRSMAMRTFGEALVSKKKSSDNGGQR